VRGVAPQSEKEALAGCVDRAVRVARNAARLALLGGFDVPTLRSMRFALTERALLAAAGFSAPAIARSSYPSHSVRLIVPLPPGASTGAVGRLTAERLSARFGQQFVVETRAGTGGMIGAEAAAHAAPDGYTLLVATISVPAIAPHLAPRLAWDPVRDPANVVGSCVVPSAILARPDLPVGDVADLIALAKSRPGTLSYGSLGNGTSGHLCAEYLKANAGIALTHVPYRGTVPLLGDLLGGRLDLAVDNLPFYVPQLRKGGLKLLAVASPDRWFSVPDTPTIAEGALPGFTMTIWLGLQAPADTPAPELGRLEAAMLAAFAEPETHTCLHAIGVEAAPSGRSAFGDLVRSEYAKWGDVVRTAGIEND
jgi:tripartite-type tricarboxylate transporter receptor subunit TctC